MWWMVQVMTAGADVPVGPVAVSVVVGLEGPVQENWTLRLPESFG